MDNDMVLLGNIDELAEHAEAPGMVRVRVRVMWRRGPWLTLTLSLTLTEAPGMVWHTATVLARKERSAVTGGMFVLKPVRLRVGVGVRGSHGLVRARARGRIRVGPRLGRG